MKMMATAFATLLAMVFTTVPARAQEDKWQFEITPYLWAAGFKGDVTVQGGTASIDKSFNDLLQYVDTAGSVMGRVQYGQWVLWGQADYMDLSDDLNTPAGGKLESEITITTVAVGYQFGGWKEGQTFDVMIGQQRLSLDNTLTLNAIGTFETKRTIDDTVLVVRPRLPLSERWQLNPDLAYGKGDSEKTWTLWPQFEYQITKTWETRIGYRLLHYDIQNGNNKFDGDLRGFTLGLGATF
ncbi:MAG: outer membrane beta-barrel protein [Burkholderiales bacterium]